MGCQRLSNKKQGSCLLFMMTEPGLNLKKFRRRRATRHKWIVPSITLLGRAPLLGIILFVNPLHAMNPRVHADKESLKL